MANDPIILVTQTKIIVPPTEKVKPEKAKPRPAKRMVVKEPSAKTAGPKASKVIPKTTVETVKASKSMPMGKITPKAERPVKVSKAPVMKPTSESGLAAKNQEAVKAGKIPNRLDVEPGRYDMLLS